jgi:hypothetical protein
MLSSQSALESAQARAIELLLLLVKLPAAAEPLSDKRWLGMVLLQVPGLDQRHCFLGPLMIALRRPSLLLLTHRALRALLPLQKDPAAVLASHKCGVRSFYVPDVALARIGLAVGPPTSAADPQMQEHVCSPLPSFYS